MEERWVGCTRKTGVLIWHQNGVHHVGGGGGWQWLAWSCTASLAGAGGQARERAGR